MGSSAKEWKCNISFADPKTVRKRVGRLGEASWEDELGGRVGKASWEDEFWEDELRRRVERTS